MNVVKQILSTGLIILGTINTVHCMDVDYNSNQERRWNLQAYMPSSDRLQNCIFEDEEHYDIFGCYPDRTQSYASSVDSAEPMDIERGPIAPIKPAINKAFLATLNPFYLQQDPTTGQIKVNFDKKEIVVEIKEALHESGYKYPVLFRCVCNPDKTLRIARFGDFETHCNSMQHYGAMDKIQKHNKQVKRIQKNYNK